MSDISNQLIKDSYNYVLQSDLATGVVYRIGGTIPVNPIFQSGLTVNSGFTYSNGTEQPGYALLTDGTGYSYWGPVSGVSPSSGVTSISASTGLSASSSTGAVTIINTAPDQTVTISGGTGITTGGTYPNFTITNTLPDQTVTITGGTNIQIAGTYPNFGVNFTGTTGLNYFVSGSTPSGVTLNSGDRWLDTTTGDELVYVNDGDSAQWIQICCGGSGGGGGGSLIGDYLPLSGGTLTGGTVFQSGLTANTISATTYQNLPSSFQSARINNTTQFSANTGTFLNFSGINITITSAATNTLVFSAATGGGGGGGVTQITAGDGISISPTGGTGNVIINSTVTDTILIASNSCIIPPDNTTYIGNSLYGWGNQNWDLPLASLSFQYANCLIPVPKTVSELTICGIAYTNDSSKTSVNLTISVSKTDCTLGRPSTIDSNPLFFDSNGILCFSYNPKISFSACTEYFALGFSVDGYSDATTCKISYTIKS